MLLFVVVVFILLLFVTRSNRLQPIVIQYQRLLAITTVAWDMFARWFYSLQLASSYTLGDNIICCVDTIRERDGR